MKPKTTKKLFAFIIILMCSVGIVNAQCTGNKVLMHHGRGCHEKCIPSGQIDKYVAQGWLLGPCPFVGVFIQSSNKVPNKPLAKIPAETAIVSKKAGSR